MSLKMSKKGVQKLQKWQFLSKKASFWTKNTRKIKSNSLRELKSGVK